MKEELYKVPGIVDISMTLENDIPEYRMRVDRDKALSAGVTTSDIVGALGRLVGARRFQPLRMRMAMQLICAYVFPHN